MVDRIFAGAPESEPDRWRQTIPLGRFAQPDEIAASIAFLTSPDAAYVNGQAYVIDGGATAGYFDV
jgi:meso-butanediol dehydrogenase/(S,S)-butanediol dehydrogenase/diacetyl reductase